MTPSQRGGLIGWLFASGAKLTAKEIKELCGFDSLSGAYFLLRKLRRTLPICSVNNMWFAVRFQSKIAEEQLEPCKWAYEQHQTGRTYHEIGIELGITRQGAFHRAKRWQDYLEALEVLKGDSL